MTCVQSHSGAIGRQFSAWREGVLVASRLRGLTRTSTPERGLWSTVPGFEDRVGFRMSYRVPLGSKINGYITGGVIHKSLEVILQVWFQVRHRNMDENTHFHLHTGILCSSGCVKVHDVSQFHPQTMTPSTCWYLRCSCDRGKTHTGNWLLSNAAWDYKKTKDGGVCFWRGLLGLVTLLRLLRFTQ